MRYLVSVIIPTYKRREFFIRRAIESVLNQSFQNIEIIVVDDNATEELSGYRTIIEKVIAHCNSDKIVYLKNNKNLGGALARNEGICIAKGQFITFLDDDDMYLSDKIKNQVEAMIKFDWDMSFTDLRLCNDKMITVDYREYGGIESFEWDYLLRYHIKNHITGTPTFMYKKNVLRDIGGFPDASMGEEFFLMLRTIESRAKIGYIPSCYVVAFRHQEGGLSYGTNKIKGEKYLYEFKKNYFPILGTIERRFVRFRHYVVMAVAYKRNGELINAIKNIGYAFVCSPKIFLKEAINHIYRMIKHQAI